MDGDEDSGNGLRTGRGLERFATTLVGLVLGQVVGNNSVTIAKAFVIWRDQPYTREWVANVSLQVIFVLATLGASFGAFAVRRKWASFEQVVTSVAIAVVVALFAIVDHSLPTVKGDEQLPFEETAYYLGWVVALWFVPFVALPSPDGSFSGWLRRGGGLLIVSATMTLACFVEGAVLELAGRRILEAGRWLEGGSYLNDPLRFWMARPVTVNAICGTFIVVTFSGIWWRGLWRTVPFAHIWTVIVSTFSIAYTGLYGWFFYAPGKSGAPWQFFLAFGALPATVTLTVLVAYGLTRRDNMKIPVGWPVSKWFWWLLPAGLGINFGLSALFGFAPLAKLDGAAANQVIVLVVAHGINGFLLGLTLRLMVWVCWLIPDGRRSVVTRGALLRH